MRIFRALLLIACLFPLASCGSGEATEDVCVLGEYTQDFSSPVGMLLITRGNYPRAMASAFLVDREKGVFATAEHYVRGVRESGSNKSLLFFNGRVYPVVLHRVAPLKDAATMRISCAFNGADFPVPLTVAPERMSVDDTVFVMGMHPHPFSVRGQNAREKHASRLVPIFREHFKLAIGDTLREKEIVFDSIGGVVQDTAYVARGHNGLEAGDIDWAKARDAVNRYYHLKMGRDHRFSHGGLSGGPVVNTNGELVGLVTFEQRQQSGIFDILLISPIHTDEILDLITPS